MIIQYLLLTNVL